MGHGSDVQNLETEAIFDEKTQEVVLNNPTVRSYKWWPGELGVTANMAVVYAMLIVKGKKKGVFPFIAKIRDAETHELLEGVEAGDIGPKFGYQGKDNGFLKFTNYRIPKGNILARFFEISNEGNVVVKGNPKIIYSSMMNVRKYLISYAASYLGKGVAIATRYSFLRTQFLDSEKQERPIIDYQTQQLKVFELLAKTYVMHGSFRIIEEKINEMHKEVDQGNFKNLQEVHIILSGTKAFFTWWCFHGLITCISSCGGHGFQMYSGIPDLVYTMSPNVILEGENTVLVQQIGRYLMKCF